MEAAGPRFAEAKWVSPLAFLVAILLHALAVIFLLRAGHVAPRPLTVAISLELATTPSAAAPHQPAPQLSPAPVPPPVPPPPLSAAQLSPAAPPAPPPSAILAAPPPPPTLPEQVLVSPNSSVALPPPPVPRPITPPPPALPVPPIPPPPSMETSRAPAPAKSVSHRAPQRLPPPHPRQFAERTRPVTTVPTPSVSPTAPRGSSAAVAAPPGQSASAAAITPSWKGALSAWLNAHKIYPDSARARGEQGTALIQFTMRRNGQVLAVALVRSSGSSILDSAAQALLRGARLPPLPPTVTAQQITITVPIRYVLQE